MAEIPVSGRVLTWAREFRGLSVEEAAERLGMSVDELTAFETEEKQPSLTKFEKLAATYRLPQATLFMRTPPQDPKMPTDFRTFESGSPRASFEFHVALSNVRTLQATIGRIDEEDSEFQRPTLRTYNSNSNPGTEGENERESIGVTVDMQLKWDSGSGFRRWRAIIERLGISVYLQKFDLRDCRGCSIWDDAGAPAILINKMEESENARTFTLIHEYAHLLLRRPGISDLRNDNAIEAYCNRFAAAFLMPVAALRRVLPMWPDRVADWQDANIRSAASDLNVSAQALAIRLEELGKAKDGLSRRFAHGPVKKKGKAKVNYVVKRLSEIGGHYTATVISALDREIIDSVEASQALALKTPQIEHARQYVERQLKLASAG